MIKSRYFRHEFNGYTKYFVEFNWDQKVIFFNAVKNGTVWINKKWLLFTKAYWKLQRSEIDSTIRKLRNCASDGYLTVSWKIHLRAEKNWSFILRNSVHLWKPKSKHIKLFSAEWRFHQSKFSLFSKKIRKETRIVFLFNNIILLWKQAIQFQSFFGRYECFSVYSFWSVKICPNSSTTNNSKLFITFCSL